MAQTKTPDPAKADTDDAVKATSAGTAKPAEAAATNAPAAKAADIREGDVKAEPEKVNYKVLRGPFFHGAEWHEEGAELSMFEAAAQFHVLSGRTARV